MKTTSFLLFILAALPLAAADFPVRPDPRVPERLILHAENLPEGAIDLPTPFANITSAYSGNARLEIEFNTDATSIKLLVPEGQDRPANILLDTAEKSVQYPDGTLVFSALDGTVEGSNAKLESHPGSHRIGFWSKIEDTVSWPYAPTRYGQYRAELTYSLASGTSDIQITFAGVTLTAELPATGSWYRYRTIDLGALYVTEEKTELKVHPLSKTGGAVMNLKAITLRPAPEGEPVLQKEAEAIELDSSQATIHGVKLRYEPKPEKSCLGYWTVPTDYASWDITFRSPGAYKIEITQGCGGGSGGSEVEVILDEQNFSFTVEDTGAFQNWKAREIGTVEITKPGIHHLEVRPRNKANAAVMDIRRIRLIPE
jgi:hypothetical protein